jgi:hypothetical protein
MVRHSGADQPPELRVVHGMSCGQLAALRFHGDNTVSQDALPSALAARRCGRRPELPQASIPANGNSTQGVRPTDHRDDLIYRRVAVPKPAPCSS